jgi:hypothetical protein
MFIPRLLSRKNKYVSVGGRVVLINSIFIFNLNFLFFVLRNANLCLEIDSQNSKAFLMGWCDGREQKKSLG